MINYIYLHMMRRFRGFRVCGLTVRSLVKYRNCPISSGKNIQVDFSFPGNSPKAPSKFIFFDCVFFGIFIGNIKKWKLNKKTCLFRGKYGFSRFWTIPVFSPKRYIWFFIYYVSFRFRFSFFSFSFSCGFWFSVFSLFYC